MNTIQILYNQYSNIIPYLIVLGTLWITYSYVILRAGFVSDDIQGIEQYDGTLLYPAEQPDGSVLKDTSGQVIKRRKICYGTLSKWVRYHICGGHFPSRHRYPKKPDGTLGDYIPSGKVPRHHHTLSLVLASIASILLYHVLLLITTPTVALMTVCLFAAHPVCTQSVAWPSAIGYILSLICICASILIASIPVSTLGGILLIVAALSFFQIWGVYAQAIPMFSWAIILLLGHWELAIVAFLVSSAAASSNLLGYVTYRKDEFKKQNMDSSTSFNIRKPIVVLKTIAYYWYHCLAPIRMGLYHKWGFHYDKKIELIDWRTISGFLLVLASAIAFYYGPMEIRFGILWFYAFLMLFLNWITAQQWVTERYAYIPVIGLCLIGSYLLQAFIPIYFLIFGLYLCRTLVHLPTYDNELRFYHSNTWNFQDSEVAYGNLGVTYSMVGLHGAAKDMWTISASLNPDYDVPLYNSFSKLRTDGFQMIQTGDFEGGFRTLANSIPVMERVLQCKVLHFRDLWNKELNDIKKIVTNPPMYLSGELNRLHVLARSLQVMLNDAKDDQRRQDVYVSIQHNQAQINNLNKFLLDRGIKMEFDPQKALLAKLTQRSQ